MAAVLRVKRRWDEEPLDALILNCKRRKTEQSVDVNEPESTLLKFAGTQINQEDDIFKHIKKSTKTEIEEQYKTHFIDIKEKLREQNSNASKNSRYKIVNLCRSDQENLDENKHITIVDIETNDVEVSSNEKETKFVYDLYYTTSDHLGEFYEHDLVSVYPLSENLVYGSHRDNGCVESENESEDSNEENNWRNDYPDEEDNNSITDGDMLDAMTKVTVENELSSDDGEEGFVYSIDSEAAGFEEDIDDSDVNRYGEQYARFKARNKSVDNNTDHTYCQNYDEEDETEDFY